MQHDEIPHIAWRLIRNDSDTLESRSNQCIQVLLLASIRS